MKSLRWFALLLMAALLFGGDARADVAQGVAWLAGRDAAVGVHRGTDIAGAIDTNAEAWLSLHQLDATAGFSGLRAVAATSADESLASVARQAIVRLQQGDAAAEQIAALLAQQRQDGGFPSHPGGGSDPASTAWSLLALDLAGRGSQTPAQRALAYLLSSQRSDGGFVALNGGDASIWATATVAPVLQRFADRFVLTDALSRIRAWLLARRQADQSFGELFETALALDALLAIRTPHAQVEAAVAALAALQQGDGGFADDAYQTALALRVLHAFAQPELPPDTAGLRGRVLSADTELPITGATLALSGAGTLTLSSNNRGELIADSMPAGAYQATLSYPGMRSGSFEFTVPANRVIDLGDLRMYQESAGGGATFAVIRGVVADQETLVPLAGARVRLDIPPSEVQTDADGRYQFLQVTPGTVRVTADAPGYSTVSGAATVSAGDILELSLRLSELEEPVGGALIQGVVRDGQSGAPLEAVEIAVADGAPAAATASAADGSYRLPVDADGIVTVIAQKPGYDTVTIRTLLIPEQVLEFSPLLYPEDETPPGANSASIRGIVVNQANRQPIANALIVATDPDGQQSLRSASDGSFRVENLTGPEVRLTISADAFDPVRLLVPVQPLEQRDIGTIGLKPTVVDFYFPDLAIVDSSLAQTDPDRFTLEQRFDVEIANRGTSNVVQDFSLLAYVDSNGNGRYDADMEPEVGRTRVSGDLPIGGSATVAIAVVAQLNFRDAPIGFHVDIDNEVPEQDENNNDGSSLLGCRVTPAFIGADTVYEAWRWSGLSSNPSINSLNQVPVVGQLTDDNGDGVINEYDIPDLVFVAAGRSQYGPATTALVAISGADGSEHWSRTDVNLSHFSSLALGDLDNDGLAEIVGVRGYRQELIAFEHNGTLKWRVPLSGPGIPAVLMPPPTYVYDQPIIVNLEGDNEAEVVLGRQVFRGSTGEKLWEGEYDAGGDGGKPLNYPVARAFGIAAISADINMDGVMEVMAGRSAYDADGRTLWHRADIKPDFYGDAQSVPMNASGHNAIGNFDLDDFPEIVLSIEDELWLLEHTGETIWGPKYAPDFGQMGAPSLADIDGDGLPEIMISSNTRLTVFESDGTVKWTATIDDQSGVTSATVFDFENDGLYEIIHMDEQDFRIFDALTGARLFETRNTSVTVYELPVVADIDGDKQAEVILTGFERDLEAGPTPGIRVFKARNGAWADAGAVWGSQAFHIDEINEDSTLPLIETPSWLTHNTYRVQRSPMPDPLGMPDFTLGDLRLIDQGVGRNPTVQVRVGNAGPVDAHEPAWLGVYRGDPEAGGQLLAETRLDTLRPARTQVVNLGEVALSGSGDLYAMVDSRSRARECREGNNTRSVPFAASNGRGELTLSTDAASYVPGQTAILGARIDNTGGIPAEFRVELQLRNAQGRLIESFDPLHAAAVETGVPAQLQQPWFTGDALAGTYVLEGRLLDAQGRQVDTASTVFAIAGVPGAPAATLRVTTDKAEYRPDETIVLSVLAVNGSDANIIRAPQVAVSVSGPQGEVQQHTFTIDDLFPGARFESALTVSGADAAAVYTATAVLRSPVDGELASDATGFERLFDDSAGLAGDVQVQSAQIQPGQPQSCLMTVRNLDSIPRQDVQVRRRLVAEADGATHWEVEESIDLGAAGSHVTNQSIVTAGLDAGLHACVLEARQGSGWRVLDSAGFDVLAGPPPGIEVTPTSGLVTAEDGRRASFSVVLSAPPAALVTIPLEPSDPNEWRIVSGELVFSPATWDLARTVEIEGLDDDLVDGHQLGLIRLLPAQSDDPGYAGLDGPDVEITNLDDDGARILVSPASIQTSEAGTSADISIALSSQPQAPVRIDLVASDPQEWHLSHDHVEFDAQNWTQAQSVTVTGVDDDRIDGTQVGLIQLLPALSDDPAYAGQDANDVQARNLDDDVGAIRVDPAVVTTSEGGAPQAFTVRLAAMPSAPVVIPIGPVDASEWRIEAIEVMLDAGNWFDGAVVVVEPVDDDDIDGEQNAPLQLGIAASADPAFDGLDAPDVALRNLDDDAARVLVEAGGGVVVSEAGTQAQFAVRLSDPPQAAVTIALQNPDAGEFALDVDELRFEAGETGPLTVTVTGVDDDEFDGNIVLPIALAPVVSTDARYHGQDPDDVLATNLDDEVPQILVQPETALITSENGASSVLVVQINTAPTAPVTVLLHNPDPGEWSLEHDSIVFDAANWTQSQQVIVTGVDDDEVDGAQTALLQLAPATSDDARFAGIDPRDVPLVNLDDDVPQVPAELLVEAVDLDVSEAGDTGALRIALSRAPQGNVGVSITSADPGEVDAEPALVEFTPQNATQPRIVVLHGIDDDLSDGDQHVTLTVGVQSAAADPDFAALAPQQFESVNRDDDTPAVRLRLIGPERLVEGESTTLELLLGSQPTAAVEIDLAAVAIAGAPPAQAWSLSPTTLRIEPEDWQQPVGIDLATRDDEAAHGDYRLRVSSVEVRSDDPVYDGLASDAIEIDVVDPDLQQTPRLIPLGRAGLLVLMLSLIALGAAALAPATPEKTRR